MLSKNGLVRKTYPRLAPPLRNGHREVIIIKERMIIEKNDYRENILGEGNPQYLFYCFNIAEMNY